MKLSTITATSIIAASTAVSGNKVTNLRKLKTITSESGNKFRKLDGFVDHISYELGCVDTNATDGIPVKICKEDKMDGCMCKGKECQECPRFELCAKCEGSVSGAGMAFKFEISDIGVSAGLVLVDSGNSFCATAFLVAADKSGVKYETKCVSDQGFYELELKFV